MVGLNFILHGHQPFSYDRCFKMYDFHALLRWTNSMDGIHCLQQTATLPLLHALTLRTTLSFFLGSMHQTCTILSFIYRCKAVYIRHNIHTIIYNNSVYKEMLNHFGVCKKLNYIKRRRVITPL